MLLQRLALEFDVGRRYVEREVNEILFEFHPDWSALRRFLVDEGFLDREHIDDQNVYWRSGGRVGGSAADLTRLPTLARMNPWETFRSVVSFRKFETDPVARRLRTAVTVDDLRRVAKRRLPRGVFDYIDGAAEDERSMAHNAAAFARLEFQPNVLCDVSAIDHSTTLLGRRIDMPLVIAPTGYTRLTHSQGELSVARAAERAGIPYSLSTMSTRSIEEVAAVSAGPKWFQVYTWKDRGLVHDLVDRAAAAGYEALWLTVDTAVLGRRERDTRRGFSIPPQIGPGTIIDGIVHPAWTLDFITHEPMTFANVSHLPQHANGGDMGRGAYVMQNFDQKLSWRDVEWLQSIWHGPIVLKGIQTVEDALRAVESRRAGHRPVEPRRAPARRRACADRAGRAGRAGAAGQCADHLRRRGATGQRRREGDRARGHRVLDRAPVPVRDGRCRRARRRPRAHVLPRGHRPHDGAHRPHVDPRHRPSSRPLAVAVASVASAATGMWHDPAHATRT